MPPAKRTAPAKMFLYALLRHNIKIFLIHEDFYNAKRIHFYQRSILRVKNIMLCRKGIVPLLNGIVNGFGLKSVFFIKGLKENPARLPKGKRAGKYFVY